MNSIQTPNRYKRNYRTRNNWITNRFIELRNANELSCKEIILQIQKELAGEFNEYLAYKTIEGLIYPLS